MKKKYYNNSKNIISAFINSEQSKDILNQYTDAFLRGDDSSKGCFQGSYFKTIEYFKNLNGSNSLKEIERLCIYCTCKIMGVLISYNNSKGRSNDYVVSKNLIENLSVINNSMSAKDFPFFSDNILRDIKNLKIQPKIFSSKVKGLTGSVRDSILNFANNSSRAKLLDTIDYAYDKCPEIIGAESSYYFDLSSCADIVSVMYKDVGKLIVNNTYAKENIYRLDKMKNNDRFGVFVCPRTDSVFDDEEPIVIDMVFFGRNFCDKYSEIWVPLVFSVYYDRNKLLSDSDIFFSVEGLGDSVEESKHNSIREISRSNFSSREDKSIHTFMNLIHNLLAYIHTPGHERVDYTETTTKQVKQKLSRKDRKKGKKPSTKTVTCKGATYRVLGPSMPPIKRNKDGSIPKTKRTISGRFWVQEHVRMQPYGPRDNPQYKEITIKGFEKGKKFLNFINKPYLVK